jgi:hypothetical protein
MANAGGGISMSLNTDLYITDFYTWCLEQAVLLEARDADALDWEHLAEEMQVLAASERRALRSFLRGLLLHLLKWHYQPSMRQTGHSWQTSIKHGRREVRDILEDEPGLRPLVDETLVRAYQYAREDASDETHLPLATFPDVCPWTLAQILDEHFWPEEEASREGEPPCRNREPRLP